MSTHPTHATAPSAARTAHPAAAQQWARIVVATLARSAVTVLLGMGFWAAAPTIIGWHPTTVMSGSMAPTVQVGDVVVARPVRAAELAPGQVLLFDDPDQPGRLRLHRFHAVGGHGTVITKGDANPQPDSTPIQRSAVHGVALTRVPFIGLPIVWIREGDGVHLALAAGVLLGLVALTGVDGALRRAPHAGARTAPRPARSPAAHAALALETRRRRLEQQRLRRRRHLASVLTTALALTGAGCLLPVEAIAAPFSNTTTNPTSSFTAATPRAATLVSCTTSGMTSTLTWSYAGDKPATFDVLVATGGGSATSIATVATTAQATNYSATYTPQTVLALGTTYTVTVRTNLTTTWTAVSAPATVAVTSVIGLGGVSCTL